MEGAQRSIPRWLEGQNATDALGMPPKRRRASGFMKKTLHDIAEALKNEVFSESLASQTGLLQGLDPRAKLVTIFILIGATGLFHHIFTLFLFNLWLFWLARTSRVPIKIFVKRVWIVVPLFTGILVFPALFNVVRPGTPLLVLIRLGRPLHFGLWTIPREVAITQQGVAAGVLLILRVGASVSLAVLLTLTTRWNTLLKALSVFRIPSVFITVLEMTYRYIFLLLQTSTDMFMAWKSRLVGRSTSHEQRWFVASAMGTLWGKTHATSEEVHSAMLSRGYTGQPKTLLHFQMKRSDWLWTALVLVVAVLFVGGDRFFG
jgi:cobalt/nickel transport system permease protein